MTKTSIIINGIVVAIVMTFLSCRQKENEKSEESDILVSVKDSVLRVGDVLKRMPRGLSTEDSLIMFNNIVDAWVTNMVLSEIAEKNIIDMGRIERMVESYRNSLIIKEYMSSMAKSKEKTLNEEKIKEYYDKHPEEFILRQPLIRGAFLKVAESESGDIDHLRKWMTDFSSKSIDNIENYGLKQASAYEYFPNEWHDWNEIAELIPYRFYDADAFVSSTKDFETMADGSVYLLHISDFLPSGSQAPYDYARIKIMDVLNALEVEAVQQRLKYDIYKKAIDEGILIPGRYNPLQNSEK